MGVTTLQFFDLILETISIEDCPSNIFKAALRTMNKLFEYKQTLIVLLKNPLADRSSLQNFK